MVTILKLRTVSLSDETFLLVLSEGTNYAFEKQTSH